ncbi:MAG TPA: nitroreductase/quinone reductase family protein [Spongiibacteraceae bacterium]|nr:nitroreductase/quinone reductase family protein [Spongiibacteraceae bacterium]
MAGWKWFGRLHRKIYLATGGRIGGRLAGHEMAIIDTLGRKSGQWRSTPIACYPYAEHVAVVASNNGSDREPAWLLNIRANPSVYVQVGSQRYAALAQELSLAERNAFWPRVVELNPPQATHQSHTARLLPIVVFKKTVFKKITPDS